MEVFKSMGAVQKDLSTMGIGKNGRNERQRFDFRQIDDIYNVLGPLLAKHDLLIIPNTLKSECKTLTSANGSPVYYARVKNEYNFISTKDGSEYKASYTGEAMDSYDKGLNKANTACLKYFLFHAFQIPLIGSDADSDSIETDKRIAHLMSATSHDQLNQFFEEVTRGLSDQAYFNQLRQVAIKKVGELDAE